MQSVHRPALHRQCIATAPARSISERVFLAVNRAITGKFKLCTSRHNSSHLGSLTAHARGPTEGALSLSGKIRGKGSPYSQKVSKRQGKTTQPGSREKISQNDKGTGVARLCLCSATASKPFIPSAEAVRLILLIISPISAMGLVRL